MQRYILYVGLLRYLIKGLREDRRVFFVLTSSVVGRRVLVLSSGWLASYVGQSEVPALITSLCSSFFTLSFGRLFPSKAGFETILFENFKKILPLP